MKKFIVSIVNKLESSITIYYVEADNLKEAEEKVKKAGSLYINNKCTFEVKEITSKIWYITTEDVHFM